MRTRVVWRARTKQPQTDVWAWLLIRPDGSGTERVDFTSPGGAEPLPNLSLDDVTLFDVLFTVQVRESAVDGG